MSCGVRLGFGSGVASSPTSISSMRGSSPSGDARLWSSLLTVAPSFVLPFDVITCSVPTSISRVSPSSDVLFDTSIDAKGFFLAENSIASIMTLVGRRLRGDRRSGTGLYCGLHWAATTAATIAVLELQYCCTVHIGNSFCRNTLLHNECQVEGGLWST